MDEPIIDSFPVYGDLFSILKRSETVDYWICNNFIQLRRIDPIVFFESYRSIFYNCPNITTSKITRRILEYKWKNDLFHFIRDMINMKYYIFLYVDRLYIKLYQTKETHIHELFIYGYNEEKSLLYCADNIRGGKYKRFNCPFSEVEKAYWEVAGMNYYTDIHCVSNEIEEDWFDNIKLNQIHKLLTEYIDSKVSVNFTERFNIKFSGFLVQEQEIEKLKQNEVKEIDLRPFCVFKEHKLLMVFRLKKLKEYLNTDSFDYFITSYTSIMNEYKIIINLGIKYNLIHESNILQRIIIHGENAIIIERNLLDDLRNLIEEYISF